MSSTKLKLYPQQIKDIFYIRQQHKMEI